jgi:hypothetical protein
VIVEIIFRKFDEVKALLFFVAPVGLGILVGGLL